MADEQAKEPVTHGAPPAPAAEPATKAEAEAKAAALAADKKGATKDGMQEEHIDPNAAKEETKKPEAKPVTQAELDAAVEKAKAEAEALKDYVQIEHPSGQAVVNLLKEAGVSAAEANTIFEKAIQSGDLTQVNWAALEAKLGKDKMVLAKSGIHQYYNEVFAVQQQTVTQVYEIYGGEDNWKTVRDWAHKQEKLDPSYARKVSEYRKMIDAGGFSAESAARALKADYEAASNTKGLNNKELHHGTTRAEPVGGPMSKREYLEARRKAEENGASPQEIQLLMARRKAGMKAGI